MSAHETAARATVTAAALALGATVELLGLGLALLAAASFATVGSRTAQTLLVASLAAGAAQFAYGLRVRFDREVFALWAARWQRAEADAGEDMRAFDRMIGRSAGPRSLETRAAGALRLLRRQVAMLLVQGLACGLALGAHAFE